MKKILSVLLAAVMVMAMLAGCTSNNPPANSTAPSTNRSEERRVGKECRV